MPRKKSSNKLEFMQYDETSEIRKPTLEEERALSDYGQFFSRTDDFEFLARLRSAKCSNREIDKWFIANEHRRVWSLAQGILAAVYFRDPP